MVCAKIQRVSIIRFAEFRTESPVPSLTKYSSLCKLAVVRLNYSVLLWIKELVLHSARISADWEWLCFCTCYAQVAENRVEFENNFNRNNTE